MNRDASDMEAFTHNPNLSWDTHADKIISIRDDVNKMGDTVAKLNQAEAEASPWQKTAITRINPILQELATNVKGTIAFRGSWNYQSAAALAGEVKSVGKITSRVGYVLWPSGSIVHEPTPFFGGDRNTWRPSVAYSRSGKRKRSCYMRSFFFFAASMARSMSGWATFKAAACGFR